MDLESYFFRFLVSWCTVYHDTFPPFCFLPFCIRWSIYVIINSFTWFSIIGFFSFDVYNILMMVFLLVILVISYKEICFVDLFIVYFIFGIPFGWLYYKSILLFFHLYTCIHIRLYVYKIYTYILCMYLYIHLYTL